MKAMGREMVQVWEWDVVGERGGCVAAAHGVRAVVLHDGCINLVGGGQGQHGCCRVHGRDRERE
eukprot:4545479-Prorocentrum_lima.AAC.1